jgi:hypothetical protein
MQELRLGEAGLLAAGGGAGDGGEHVFLRFRFMRPAVFAANRQDEFQRGGVPITTQIWRM